MRLALMLVSIGKEQAWPAIRNPARRIPFAPGGASPRRCLANSTYFMLVPFLDTGRVFDSVGDTTLKDWKLNAGIGFRLAWNLSTVASFDYAKSGKPHRKIWWRRRELKPNVLVVTFAEPA